MECRPFVIVLTGPSSCGKTYVTNKIVALGKQLQDEGIDFHPKRFFKYVTRPYREIEIIEKNKGLNIDVESVRSIPIEHDGCELVYRTYGNEYGLRLSDLTRMLKENVSPIVVINDVRVVEELKREFREQVLSVFIFREIIPDVETHKSSGTARGAGSDKQSITRFEKAVALYRVFIENIFIFDRVILNVEYQQDTVLGGVENIVHIQTENLIRGVIDGRISLATKRKRAPRLFIISGNAASGKDDIIKAANRMGILQTDILKKHTSRWQEVDDENEIVCKYRPKSSLVAKYNRDYEREIAHFERTHSFDAYRETHEQECQDRYEGKSDIFRANCSFEEHCRARYTIATMELKNRIRTGLERFWDCIRQEQEKRSLPIAPGSSSSELPESEYTLMRETFFEENSKCFDLAEIKKQHVGEIDQQVAKISDKTENRSYFLRHAGKDYILYENNSLYNKPVDYGFEVGSIRDTWKDRKKHILLTASLPNIFRMCREIFGLENVITAFTYSQISQEEHLSHSDRVMGRAKLKEYRDILRYANHIVDFDYALIYAETSLTNSTGNQKSELVDQMFRLFRTYNE